MDTTAITLPTGAESRGKYSYFLNSFSSSLANL